MTALVLLLGGMAAGCLGALAGVGGGILLVPLMSVLGVPFPIAVATSLVAVIATSSGSAVRFLEDDLCDVRLGIQLETATVTGAIVGGLAATRIPVGALRVAFGVLALYLAIWQFLMARQQPAADDTHAGTGTFTIRNLPVGMAVSAVAGAISALLGIGGGALKVPVMNMVMGVPFRVASATSNYMIGVTAAASALLYFRRGQIDLGIAAPTVLGVLAGAALGSRLMPKVPVARLRALFGAVLVVIAVQMFWRGLAP